MCKDKKGGLNLKTDTGVRLPSYRAAVAYMEENTAYTKEDIEKMYMYPDGKNHTTPPPSDEDWITNEFLPEGWLCKDRKEGANICIKTNTGVRFSSYRASVEYMEENNEYAQENIERFHLYPDGKNHSPRPHSSEEWKTNEYLPEGWTCKRTEGSLKINFKTNTGFRLSSYRSAAIYIEENSEYTQEDVDKIFKYPDGKSHERQLPSDEDWITNEYLPEGWMCKERKEGPNICVKTKNGVKINSYRGAVEHVEENSKYTKEDLEKLYLYPDGKNHAQNFPFGEDWKTSEYLPAGWTCRDRKSGLHLRTDTGVKLSSYRTAAVYMEENREYTKEDIEKVYLYPDGVQHARPNTSDEYWKTSEYLPEGWKYKESGTHHLNLLTEDGTRLSSYIAATRYMQYRGGYTSTSLHQLYTFPDGKNHFVGKKMPSLEG